MTESLPSRSNQDEFPKSNTAPQSAGTVVYDKNGNDKMTAQWQNTFPKKPGKNVVNTSRNGPSFNLFKIISWLCN